MLEDADSNLNNFKTNVLEALTPEGIGKLVNKLAEVKDFNKSNHILELFKCRADWLEDQIINLPKQTWCMVNAKLPDKYTKIEDFLKSDKANAVIDDVFQSAGESNSFIRKFGDLKYSIQNGYSARMFSCIDKNGSIDVYKTKDYHDYMMRNINEYKRELAKIKNLNLNI
jgi:hypothetical protein